jgi:Flp pilus assembly protein TadD
MPKLPTPSEMVAQRGIGNREALMRRAREVHMAGKLEDAAALYLRVLEVAPLDLEAMNFLGIVYGDTGALIPAIVQFENTLRIDPTQTMAWLNRGIALSKLGQNVEALNSLDQVLTLDQDNTLGHFHRGNVLYRVGRFAEALEAFDTAAIADPENLSVVSNRAAVLARLHHFAEAEAAFEHALALDQSHNANSVNWAMMVLTRGDFRRGLALFEHRLDLPGVGLLGQASTAPMAVDRTALNGKTILVQAEQGMADTLQFVRYGRLLAETGARVVCVVQPPLTNVVRTSPWIAETISDDQVLPAHDLRVPAMSLPLLFGTEEQTIPGDVPYLTADRCKVAAWRDKLAGLGHPRVGLVWAGGSRGGNADLIATDQRRSVALATLAPFWTVSGCAFVSLQIGQPATQTAELPAGLVLHDFTAAIHEFDDTAALIENLDLVISVDTSTAHLAGALARPVWLLNRFDTCWRWLLDREDTPWYPTMRIFRQPAPGDWGPVIARVTQALREFAAT